MTERTNDDNLYDEKYLTKVIAEEEEFLKKSQGTLDEYQANKKRISANIRTLTYKMKTLEEELTTKELFLEKLKSKREKYVSMVDMDAINKLINSKCGSTMAEMIEKANPNDMKIEVEFERQKTVFKVHDYRINSPKRLHTESESHFESSTYNSRTGSILESEKVKFKKEKNLFTCKTFKEMKQEVAPFFSLPAEGFFFADSNNMIFLDDMPIRPTLFPSDLKLKNKTASIKIILPNNHKYDEIIAARYKEKVIHKIVEEDPVHKAELREAYDNEQARKLADQLKSNALQYQLFKARIFRYKGLCTAILYAILILIWLINKIVDFDYEKTTTMMTSTKHTFDYTFTTNTAQFYGILKSDLFAPSISRPEYGFFSTTYIFPTAEIVITRYKPIKCVYSTDFMEKYYQQNEIACTDAIAELDTEPFQANGIIYYYNDDPDRKVRVPTRKGFFNNLGYRLPVDFNDPNMQTKISNFVNSSVSEFVSLNSVFFNPSLQKIACTYRIVYRYNQDKTNTDKFIYVFNVKPNSQSAIIIQGLILGIASLLVISSILDIIHYVPKAKVELDLDLVWIRKANKGTNIEEENDRHKPKFKVISLGGSYLKILSPSPLTLLNLASVVMNLVVAGIDIAQDKLISEINLDTGKNINCPVLVEQQTTNQIMTTILVLLMMIVLLQYVAQFIPTLEIFIVMIKNVISNTTSLGVIILWFFLSISLFGVYTYGSFFPLADNFFYFYAATILLMMRHNVLLSTQVGRTSTRNAYANIGSDYVFGAVLSSYIIVTLIIMKILISNVIKSMKEAQGSQKKMHDKEQEIREESLRFLREQFYQEFRAAQSKIRAKFLEEAKNAPEKPKETRKLIPL